MTDSSIGDKETGRDIPPSGEDSVDSLPTDRSLGDLATRRAELQRRHYRVGSVLLGRYRITGELGQGGMGVVFRCFDEVGGIEVALKALPPELSHNSVEMEEVRENFRLVQGLHHPHIAAVKHLEKDPDSGDYYLVMECVEGVNLRQWRRKEAGSGGVPLDRVSPILRQVAEALDFAHGQRIIHRDIKPSNVMIKADGTVKVLDFGLAAQIHTSLSRVSRVAQGTSGTGPYMAPEQWRGQYQDAATDQYALAVMTYELLSGRLPFENPDISVLREAVIKEPPPPIPGLDPKAWKALQVGLGKARDGRFPSCRQFVAALEGRAPARPVAARSRRRKAVLATFLLAAAVFGGYWAYTTYWSDSFEQQEVTHEAAELPSEQPPPPPAPPAVAPVPTVVAETPAPAELQLTIRPGGAQVTLHGDDGLAGTTTTGEDGLFVLPLAPGRYDLVAQKDGYELLTTELDMGVDALAREYALAPLRGGLTVATVAGAAITAVRAGTDREIALGEAGTDGQLHYDRLVEGVYELRITHPDYRPRTIRAEVRRDRPVSADGRLEGLPGTLFIAASPQAEVWVDGEHRGRTGEDITDLSPGRRRIEVRRAGYQTVRFEETVLPNRPLRKVLGTLARASGSIRIVAEVPENARAHFQGLEKRIRIGSNPWKTVTLPYTEEGLACEEHEVQLEVAGFRVDAASRRVTVRDGETSEARFTLTPEPARLTVTANAPGAEVLDDSGRKLGSAGTAFEVPSLAALALVVRASGHADGRVNIPGSSLPPGGVHRETVRLEEQRYPDLNSPFENSLGMKFNPVPGTEVLFGVWATRVQDYQRFVDATGRSWSKPSFEQGPTHPAANVSWDDAVAFCEWLTGVERAAGLIGPNQEYRLPRDWEWSVAVGLNEPRGGTPRDKNEKIQNVYPWNRGRGTWPPPSGAGNYAQRLHVDRFPNTSPVGSFDAHAHGLHDLGGNVWEWCEDFFDGRSGSRVLRGGSWVSYNPRSLLSSYRNGYHPGARGVVVGFRVVLSGPSP